MSVFPSLFGLQHPPFAVFSLIILLGTLTKITTDSQQMQICGLKTVTLYGSIA
jgi:hypothetical protein